MSHDHQASSSNANNAQNTWTEPPWSGWIETTGDALLILEAARRGLIPRVTRRLVDSERKMITSGSVFVFDEDESGIKRWTDGFFWSPSRILGNFLLYRETEKKGAGHRSARSGREPIEEAYVPEGVKLEPGQSLSRPKSETNRLGIDRQRERSLVGSLTNSYKFKQGGMMKKTFSLTIGGVVQHLISYYKVEDVEQGRLRSPSTLPELASLDISPEYLDKTHFRNPPKVEIGVDGIPRYRGEADDIETSPTLVPTSLISPSYDEPSSSKRSNAKRYDPYGTPQSSTTGMKRPRKTKSGTTSRSQDTDDGSSPIDNYGDPQPTATSSHYPETTVATATPAVAYPAPPYGYYHTYPVPAGYPSTPYPPAPTSPVTAPPQQSPTPPQQSPTSAITYSGYTPRSEAPPQPQAQSHGHPPATGYPHYYSAPPPAPHGYGTYSGMWPQYPGYAAQSNERVQKQEREDSV